MLAWQDESGFYDLPVKAHTCYLTEDCLFAFPEHWKTYQPQQMVFSSDKT